MGGVAASGGCAACPPPSPTVLTGHVSSLPPILIGRVSSLPRGQRRARAPPPPASLGGPGDSIPRRARESLRAETATPLYSISFIIYSFIRVFSHPPSLPPPPPGRYYIATAADRIVAMPGTVTGSIGAFFGKVPCPLSTGGGTRLVRLVRGEGRGVST